MSKFFKRASESRRLLIFIFSFAIVASVILIVSHAASPNTSLEPEKGTGRGVTLKNDTNSSSGGFVQFGSTNRSRLGVDINSIPSGVTLARAYDTMALMGFGWVRSSVFVSDYSNLNPGNFDYELSQAKRTNLKALVTITYAYGTTGCSDGHCKPRDPAAWADYVGKLVARWKTNYPGVVGAVEIWNEANNPNFWDPVDPNAYTDLLKRSYLEIKTANPKMTVVVSGPAPGGGNRSADSTSDPNNPATFYKQMYAAGAKGFFDAAANHPYDTRNLAANVVGNGPRNNFWIRQEMDSHGDQTKQIWGTEAGVVSCLKGPGSSNSPFTEAQRAIRLAVDLQDFWHGIHDQTTGATIRTNDPEGDLNAGPYFIFKLYKTTPDAGLGIIYNTNAYMRSPPSSELPNPGGDPEPQCKSSVDYYVPGSVSGKAGMANIILDFSRRAQLTP